MSSKARVKIQFPRGGIIPKDVMKTEKDVKVAPGEPVSVPKDYGAHVVGEQFAEKVELVGRKTTAPPKAELVKLQAAVGEAETALEAADTDAAKALAKADLDAAGKALVAAGA